MKTLAITEETKGKYPHPESIWGGVGNYGCWWPDGEKSAYHVQYWSGPGEQDGSLKHLKAQAIVVHEKESRQ